MVEVRKNGIKMTVRDNNQLSAFLNNGWKKVTAEEVEKTTSSTVNSKSQKEKAKQ